MQVDIINFDGKAVGKVELSDQIFGLDPRADILHKLSNKRKQVTLVRVKDTMFICVVVA